MPRRLAVPVALLLVLAATAAPARADKYAAEFLKIGVGARALGMGDAFVGVADDASAGYWNPAGLVFVQRSEVEAMHAEQFGSIVNFDYVAYAHPLEKGKNAGPVLGITLVRSAVDNIPIVNGSNGAGTPQYVKDHNGNDSLAYVLVDEGRIQWKSDADLAFLLSYARPVSRALAVGVSAKLIRQQLIANSSFGIGTDVGVMYTPNAWLTAGLRVADATTTLLSWDTGRKETVMPSARVGLAVMRDVPRLDGVVTLAADANLTFEGRTGSSQFAMGRMAGDLALGAEYWYRRTLAVRLGDAGGQLAAGAGLRWGRFGVDYAFVGHQDLDTSQRIQALMTF